MSFVDGNDFIRVVASSMSCCTGVRTSHYLRSAEKNAMKASKQFANGAALATDPNSKVALQKAEQASIDGFETARTIRKHRSLFKQHHGDHHHKDHNQYHQHHSAPHVDHHQPAHLA